MNGNMPAGLAGLASVILCWATVAGAGAQEGAGVQVEVLLAAPATMSRITTQPATVHAYHLAHIFSKANGYVSELPGDIGQAVKTGDALAVLEIPELGKQREAQLATVRQMEAEERRAASQKAVAEAEDVAYHAKHDQARAEVEKADANLVAVRVEMERVSELVRQRAVADQLLDEVRKRHDAAAAHKAAAEAAVAAAAADLGLASSQVQAAVAEMEVAKAVTDVARRKLDELDELTSYTQVTAPFSGVVIERNVDLGDLVSRAQAGVGRDVKALFIVAQLDRVRVRVAVPERDAPHADVGDAATLTFQALPGRVFQGKISRVAGVLAQQTRTMLVEIDLPNADGKLRPGMFGQAKVTLAPPRDSVMLPAGAVRYDESGKSYVYVVNGQNVVEVVDVVTGLDDGNMIEITSGLRGGERVVGPQLRRLRAGQKVVVKG